MARLRDLLFPLFAAFVLTTVPAAVAQDPTAAPPSTAPPAVAQAPNETASSGPTAPPPSTPPPCCEPVSGNPPEPMPFPQGACAQRMADAKGRMEAFFRSTAEDWRQLGQAMAGEHQSAAVPPVARATMDAGLPERAEAVHAAQQARLEALRAEFGDCGRFLPAQVPFPPFTPGGPGPGFGDQLPAIASNAIIHAEPAFPADPERRQLAEKAMAMRQACEAEVRVLFEARMPTGVPALPLPAVAPQPLPIVLPDLSRGDLPVLATTTAEAALAQATGATLPVHSVEPIPLPAVGGPAMAMDAGLQAGPFAMDAGLEAKAQRIRADCEVRIRTLFQEHEERARRDHPEGMHERFGSLAMAWDEAAQRIGVTGTFLSLRGDPETQAMADIACNGPLYVDRLAAGGFLAEFDPEQTMGGTVLHVKDAQHAPVLDLHDNPRCTLNIAASPSVPFVTLDLADHLGCAQAPSGDVRCQGGVGVEALVLVHDGRAVLGNGNEVTVYGRATFLVSDGAQAGAAALGNAYEAAVKDKRIGAEVRVVAAPDGGHDRIAVDAATIGDLQVNVTGSEGRVTAVIDSPAGVGKTVSLRIDRAVFASSSGVAVRVDAVAEDGTKSALAARESDSLEDALDPADDDGSTEYWVVQDKNGFQVLVSFPHFSTKVVTVQPADAATETDRAEAAGRSIPAPPPLLTFAAIAVAAAAGRRLLSGARP